jgi:tetratricopeptide (TPR) repeat protein
MMLQKYIKVVVLLYGCLLLFFGGCTYATNTIRASRYIRRGNPDQAIKILTKDILRKHGDYLTYFYLAKAYKNKGEYNKALVNFNKSIELNTSYFYSQLNAGILCAQMGKHELAFMYYNRAIRLQPNSFNVHLFRGHLYHVNNKYNQALADYNKALLLKPRDMRTLVYKARLFYDMGKNKKATITFKNALKLYKNEAKVLDEYAWTLVMTNDLKYKNPQKALILATEAVKLFPCSVSYDTLAAVNAHLNNFANAVIYQEKAIILLQNLKQKDPRAQDYLLELKKRLRMYEHNRIWKESPGSYRNYAIFP